MQLALVVFYLPYIIFFMLGYSVERHGVGEVFAWYFSVTLVYFNSSLNPILYCWKIKEVRQVVKDTSETVLLFLVLSLTKKGESYGKMFVLGMNNVGLKQHSLDNRDLYNIPQYLFWFSLAVKQI